MIHHFFFFFFFFFEIDFNVLSYWLPDGSLQFNLCIYNYYKARRETNPTAAAST